MYVLNFVLVPVLKIEVLLDEGGAGSGAETKGCPCCWWVWDEGGGRGGAEIKGCCCWWWFADEVESKGCFFGW